MRPCDVKRLRRFFQDYFNDSGPGSEGGSRGLFRQILVPDPAVAAALKKFLCLLLLFSLTRLLFFCVQHDYFASLSLRETVCSFLWGVRFDLSVVSWVSLLLWGLWASPLPLKTHPLIRRLADLGLWFAGSLALLPNIADAKYFSFSSQRMTADIFRQLKTLAGEDVGSYGAILRDSCGLWLLWIVLSIFLGNFIKCRHFEEDLAWARIRRERTLPRMGIRCLSFAFWICMLIIGCRGGLCGRVLDPPCVVRLSQQPSGGVLMGNSSFSILKSLGRRPIRSFHFFDSAEELNGIYSPFHVAKPQSPYFGRYKGKNILILILESFSAEHVGFLDREFKEKQSDCTPFLDALAQRSLCFDGFANGSISPDGLVSIFSSIPALQGIPYIRSSRGIANHIEGLSSLLARSGYHDSFFYGGKRYSCDFDCYWRKVGLKRYFCEENFPQKITKNIYSGWGIHDLAWLSYAADVLSREPEPFISGIFTLSSHHPFGIPKGFENTFPKGRHPIQELVAYADYALKCFFEKISSEPWYKNTLFVLVADHTSGAVEPYYHGPIGSFSIPILLFDPEGHLPLECAGQLAQQIDLFPTLLHLLGHAEAHVAFGHDLLDEKHPHFAVNFRHEIYQLLGDDYLLQFDGQKSIGFFDRKKDPLAQRNLLSEPQYDALRRSYERCLQAFLQHYSQVLTQDTLTLENWMRAKNSKASGFTI